jgi:sugar lactone lactonase YvrE
MRMRGGWSISAIAMSAVLLAMVGCLSAPPAVRGDILIDDTRVFPESVTSTAAGAVMVGSMKGIVYRALPHEPVASAWIRPDAVNGLQSVFGVLADERSATLWVCSVPNPFERAAAPAPSALVAFDLASGRYKSSYPFPGSRGVCNDVAIAPDGAAYATDTPNGRILKLSRGAAALEVYAEDERLKGIDGLVFSATGVLYVNIVSRGTLIRVDRDGAGNMRALQELTLSRPLSGPDGFRLLDANRFLLAEGTAGRIDEVSIEGDVAQIRTLREGLNASAGVTRVGALAYAIEGKIGYLIDAALKGKDPGAFAIRAIPLN